MSTAGSFEHGSPTMSDDSFRGPFDPASPTPAEADPPETPMDPASHTVAAPPQQHSGIDGAPPSPPRDRYAPDLAAAGRRPDALEMDGDIAAYWDLWSAEIGQRVLPTLSNLQHTLPTLTSAMICTADGFNLCALGVEEHRVSQVSALTSSLHSIAGAMSESLHESRDGDLGIVSLSSGPSQTVVVAIGDLIVGDVLLWVTADGVSLGVLLVRARAAAEEVRRALAKP